MRVIYNGIIPFKGFKCVNLFGILFVRKGCTMSGKDFTHKAIHTAQMRVVNLIRYDPDRAYYEISFEREAYRYENNPDYLKSRNHYNQYKTDSHGIN